MFLFCTGLTTRGLAVQCLASTTTVQYIYDTFQVHGDIEAITVETIGNIKNFYLIFYSRIDILDAYEALSSSFPIESTYFEMAEACNRMITKYGINLEEEEKQFNEDATNGIVAVHAKYTMAYIETGYVHGGKGQRFTREQPPSYVLRREFKENNFGIDSSETTYVPTPKQPSQIFEYENVEKCRRKLYFDQPALYYHI